VMAVAAGNLRWARPGHETPRPPLPSHGVGRDGPSAVANGRCPPPPSTMAGLGDLLATANSSLSRNSRFGRLKMAQGVSAAEAGKNPYQATVEGPRLPKGAYGAWPAQQRSESADL